MSGARFHVSWHPLLKTVKTFSHYGRAQVSYWVDRNRIQWAINHVASKYQTSGVTLYRACAGSANFQLIPWGVYIARKPIKVIKMHDVSMTEQATGSPADDARRSQFQAGHKARKRPTKKGKKQ